MIMCLVYIVVCMGTVNIVTRLACAICVVHKKKKF